MSCYVSRIPNRFFFKSQKLRHRIYQLGSTADSAHLDRIGCTNYLVGSMPYYLEFCKTYISNPGSIPINPVQGNFLSNDLLFNQKEPTLYPMSSSSGVPKENKLVDRKLPAMLECLLVVITRINVIGLLQIKGKFIYFLPKIFSLFLDNEVVVS